MEPVVDVADFSTVKLKKYKNPKGGMEKLCEHDCSNYSEVCKILNCFHASFSAYICCCCMTPIALLLLVILLSIPFYLICFCPPLLIVLSALPCLRSERSGVYDFLDGSNKNRADPAEAGHVVRS
jgi:hypothetical protein